MTSITVDIETATVTTVVTMPNIVAEIGIPGLPGVGGGGNVLSVNGHTGTVVLDFSDVGAAEAVHGHDIADVAGLQSALDAKATAGTAAALALVLGG
jgi:hypothetical protein